MDMFIRILIVILGIGILLFGIIYKKKDHKETHFSGGSDLIDFFILITLALSPYYVTKVFFILLGLFFILGPIFL